MKENSNLTVVFSPEAIANQIANHLIQFEENIKKFGVSKILEPTRKLFEQRTAPLFAETVIENMEENMWDPESPDSEQVKKLQNSAIFSALSNNNLVLAEHLEKNVCFITVQQELKKYLEQCNFNKQIYGEYLNELKKIIQEVKLRFNLVQDQGNFFLN
jgi:hypothetical protein